MKGLKIAIIAIITLSLGACNDTKKEVLTHASTINKIEVIDFHSTHRCITCKAIESNAKYTLETYFEKELTAGTIIFKVVNVDDEKNAAIAENFEAAGTALFLNIIKDGNETHIDLTEFAFMKGKEQEAFAKELKGKINEQLSLL